MRKSPFPPTASPEDTPHGNSSRPPAERPATEGVLADDYEILCILLFAKVPSSSTKGRLPMRNRFGCSEPTVRLDPRPTPHGLELASALTSTAKLGPVYELLISYCFTQLGMSYDLELFVHLGICSTLLQLAPSARSPETKGTGSCVHSKAYILCFQMALEYPVKASSSMVLVRHPAYDSPSGPLVTSEYRLYRPPIRFL
ncbi:hypothetical protein FZEAL_4328 [Fusarium zealandicum]|uniref:Uncharacterized protein n=1 Tax=Fusarium zealandicum TaxID=1053134 RepID=A0A8H4XKY0_9HYPO|nr:hypothetical protein FZEAL_4328 [Fusarium zealandicum]